MAIERYYREYEGDLMTAAEYCRLPEVDHGSTELTDGRLVFRLGVHYSKHAVTALNIMVALRAFVDPRNLGIVTAQQYEYDLTRPGDEGETVWHPDLAFLRTDLLPLIDAADQREIAPRSPPILWWRLPAKASFAPKCAATSSATCTPGRGWGG